jgi:hypothetical protein
LGSDGRVLDVDVGSAGPGLAVALACGVGVAAGVDRAVSGDPAGVALA